MMFSNGFVVAVKVGNSFIDELANGTVVLPFGTEYTIRLKNKNKRRAVAQIYIDGENVSEGGYVVNADSHVDIERHASKPVKFKFVSLNSAEAIDAGKNGANPDKQRGLVEVRWYFEKEKPKPQTVIHNHYHNDSWIKPYKKSFASLGDLTTRSSSLVAPTYGPPMASASLGITDTGTGINSIPTTLFCCNNNTLLMDWAETEPARDGCTTEGSYSNQSFSTTWVETEDTYTAIKIFLQGNNGALKIAPETPTRVNYPRKSDNSRETVADISSEVEDLEKKIKEMKTLLEQKKKKAKLEEDFKKLQSELASV